ncbi:triphosphoribosyl-dephospho-CoA synthase CitG [Lacticaseibacillus baoqingensis]|uniref:Probable 2-(5''-triphosphoribosyl)-3'-dephosphocoenzyme-A synthase n=1 Tax=Lacticaseibacillus baoqingensis TaxID=2486013 RepID=A0ABW4E7S6_9LACO|nr:triphosphoribosyl-dephospho-CoA synthase CitG [Lacticaseibacillus baoqingensis]
MTDLTTAIAEAAYQALCQEVALAPKPGLVDPFSPGAHTDMDYPLFLRSAQALRPFFRQYLAQGEAAKDLAELFEQTRTLGVQAEKAMLAATGGVNTHQGANFTFGFFLASMGWTLQQTSLKTLVQADYAPVWQALKALTHGRLMSDFRVLKTRPPKTYGEKLYAEYGIIGVRGEAEAGYPLLQAQLLPFLARDSHTGDLRYLRLMLLLMQTVEDTNLIHRGGVGAFKQVQQDAQALAAVADDHLVSALQAYDRILIKRHLSPGGTADFLAIGYFFDQLTALVQAEHQ